MDTFTVLINPAHDLRDGTGLRQFRISVKNIARSQEWGDISYTITPAGLSAMRGLTRRDRDAIHDIIYSRLEREMSSNCSMAFA